MTKDEITSLITSLKNETVNGSITASRLGNILEGIISLMPSSQFSISLDKTTSANTLKLTINGVTKSISLASADADNKKAGLLSYEDKARLDVVGDISVVKVGVDDFNIDTPNFFVDADGWPVNHIRTVLVNGAVKMVFCAYHKDGSSVGAEYFVYEEDSDSDVMTPGNSYNSSSVTVPSWILRAFGEAVATSTNDGMMSAADKRKIAAMESFLEGLGYNIQS